MKHGTKLWIVLLAGNLSAAALPVSQAAAQLGSGAVKDSPAANASYFGQSDVIGSFKSRSSGESNIDRGIQSAQPGDNKPTAELSADARTHSGATSTAKKASASAGTSHRSVVELISNVLPSSQPQRSITPLGTAQRSELASSEKSRNARPEQLHGEPNGAAESRQQAELSGKTSEVDKRTANRDRDPLDLLNKIKRLGLATFLVLAGCFACLLVAKKFGVTKLPGDSSESKINVIETKRLSSRCMLKLIEIESCKFLIAFDNSGVKSVQPVNKSFPETFEELNQEVAAESAEAAGNTVQSSRLASLIGKW